MRRLRADWLFFGLTAGALMIVRARDTAPDGAIARMPGDPWTTVIFIEVAIGIVVNSFVAYPVQSLIGSAILTVAAVAFFIRRAARSRPPTRQA